MTKRISNIDNGTFGDSPSQLAFNQILMKHDNAYITRKATSRYYKFKEGIQKLLVSNLDPQFSLTVLLMWKDKCLEHLDSAKDLPEDVYTHLRCCMVAEFRNAHNSILKKKKSRRTPKSRKRPDYMDY